MIFVKLTPGMFVALPEGAIERARVKAFDRGVAAPEEQIAALAVAFDAAAAALEGVKGQGTVRRVALAGAQRCREAITKEHRRAAAPIHVSIPVDEQDALRAIANGDVVIGSDDAIARLRRRDLMTEDGELTRRGRAIVDGTPPGDLVPFAHFVPDVRVALAADLVLEDREVPAGEIFCVVEAKDGRLTVYDGALQIGPCHPRIFFVLRGE